MAATKTASKKTSQPAKKAKSTTVYSTYVLKPRMTEKTYALSTAGNTFVFDVPTKLNKIQIAKSVEEQFGVSVVRVKTTTVKGKDARSIRISARVRANVSGKRVDIKKAFVTLKDGDSIPVFAALDEQVKAEEKAAEKAVEKAKKAEAKSEDSSTQKKKTGLAARLGRKKETK